MGTVLIYCFCTEQIPYGVILKQKISNLMYCNKQRKTNYDFKLIKNLSIEENSCKIIVFLVLATKKLQREQIYNKISKINQNQKLNINIFWKKLKEHLLSQQKRRGAKDSETSIKFPLWFPAYCFSR